MNRFELNIIGVHQKKGILWLKELNDILDKCKNKWNITSLIAFENLSYNFVAKVFIDKKEFVLKVGVPCYELISEIETLIVYRQQRKYVNLIDYDLDLGALLLEYLSPAITLSKIDDESATIVAANLMKNLYITESKKNNFKHLKNWAKGFTKLKLHLKDTQDTFHYNLVSEAEKTFYKLCESTENNVVLHGDLHHDNIISDNSSWKIIDPKGIVGDIAFEPSAFLRNYLMDKREPQRTLNKRIEIFSEILEIDSKRIIDWGFAQTILSASWAYEDNLDSWKEELELAKLFL